MVLRGLAEERESNESIAHVEDCLGRGLATAEQVRVSNGQTVSRSSCGDVVMAKKGSRRPRTSGKTLEMGKENGSCKLGSRGVSKRDDARMYLACHRGITYWQ
jgi:hypothetical protein